MTAIIDDHIYAQIAATRGQSKRCNACNTEHPLTAFAFKNKAEGKLHALCREAQKGHSKANYQANAGHARQRSAARRKQVTTEVDGLVDGWLAGQSCASCGSTDRLTAVTAEHGSLKRLTKAGYNADGIRTLLERASVRCRSCGGRG